MSVLFLVLDGLSVRHVGRRHTPTLARLAADGGWAPADGRAVLPTSTYPNHATFVTGVGPAAHGVHGNHVVDHTGVRDTAGHLDGPDSDAALRQYRDTDAVLAEIVGALAPRWSEWAVVVVSDHDQETVTDAEPVDLHAAARAAGAAVTVVDEGGSALVHGSPRQAAQAAVCGGGHPAVPALAAALRRDRPAAAGWAAIVRRLVGVERAAMAVSDHPTTSC